MTKKENWKFGVWKREREREKFADKNFKEINDRKIEHLTLPNACIRVVFDFVKKKEEKKCIFRCCWQNNFIFFRRCSLHFSRDSTTKPQSKRRTTTRRQNLHRILFITFFCLFFYCYFIIVVDAAVCVYTHCTHKCVPNFLTHCSVLPERKSKIYNNKIIIIIKCFTDKLSK